jgi:hypothetical protein
MAKPIFTINRFDLRLATLGQTRDSENAPKCAINALFQQTIIASAFFCLPHLLLIFAFLIAKTIRNSSFFGVAIHVDSSILIAASLRILFFFAIKFIPFCLFAGLCIALVFRKPTQQFEKSYAKQFRRISITAYFVFTILLLLSRPGSFEFIPVLRVLPFVFCILITVISLFALLAYTPGSLSARTLLVVGMVGIINIPHSTFRQIPSFFKGKIDQQTPHRLILVLDSARLDDFLSHTLGNSSITGFSHFQSTRKQWLLMLGDEPDSIQNLLFIPTNADERRKHEPSQFEKACLAKKYKLAFLLDDGGTANRDSLPLNLTEVSINGESIDSTASPQYVPISGWLQNLASDTESANIYADSSAFLEDARIAVNHNDAVFAHSCYLERPITTWVEFFRFRHFTWLKEAPRVYSSGSSESSRTDKIPASKISSFKTGIFLERANALFEDLAKTIPHFSGLLTSDHGQDYQFADKHPGPSFHGFSSNPGTVWIPVLPYGETRIQNQGSWNPITWLDIRKALTESLAHHTSLTIVPSVDAIFASFIYVLPPPKTPPGVKIDDRILSVNSISRFTKFVSPKGLTFISPIEINTYLKCYSAFIPETGLFTINPSVSGGYKIQHWEGLNLVDEHRIPSDALEANLEALGFRKEAR